MRFKNWAKHYEKETPPFLFSQTFLKCLNQVLGNCTVCVFQPMRVGLVCNLEAKPFTSRSKGEGKSCKHLKC